MAESSEKLYRAEYAKSGRASCKKCSESIPKDSLRMAIMVQVRAGELLCAQRGFRVREERAGPAPRTRCEAWTRCCCCSSSVWPAGWTLFRQVLLIVQEKPGKYSLELVVPFCFLKISRVCYR